MDYAITVEGHSLYSSIGFGLQTMSEPLAVLTAEALGIKYWDSRVQVWKKEDGLGGLNSWKCIGYTLKGRWHRMY